MKECGRCGGGKFKDYDPYCDHNEMLCVATSADVPGTRGVVYPTEPPLLIRFAGSTGTSARIQVGRGTAGSVSVWQGQPRMSSARDALGAFVNLVPSWPPRWSPAPLVQRTEEGSWVRWNGSGWTVCEAP